MGERLSSAVVRNHSDSEQKEGVVELYNRTQVSKEDCVLWPPRRTGKGYFCYLSF